MHFIGIYVFEFITYILSISVVWKGCIRIRFLQTRHILLYDAE